MTFRPLHRSQAATTSRRILAVAPTGLPLRRNARNAFEVPQRRFREATRFSILSPDPPAEMMDLDLETAADASISFAFSFVVFVWDLLVVIVYFFFIGSAEFCRRWRGASSHVKQSGSQCAAASSTARTAVLRDCLKSAKD